MHCNINCPWRLPVFISCSMDSGGIVWHSKLYNDSLTPKTTKIFNRRTSFSESSSGLDTTELWTDSPWPARNNVCFTTLNSFMERCNDVLELVQTTQHFEMLTCTAEVGGAGGNSLDSQVKEIHLKFLEAVRSFQQMPHVRSLVASFSPLIPLRMISLCSNSSWLSLLVSHGGLTVIALDSGSSDPIEALACFVLGENTFLSHCLSLPWSWLFKGWIMLSTS